MKGKQKAQKINRKKTFNFQIIYHLKNYKEEETEAKP